MERSLEELFHSGDKEAFNHAMDVATARSLLEGVRERLESVSLEETEEQVGSRGPVSPPPSPPVSPQSYVGMAEGLVAREIRQAECIRREMERMQELLLRTGSQMTDNEKGLAEYHALDLRDISYAVRDLVVEADMAVPALLPLLDAAGPDAMAAPGMPHLDPNAPVLVSSVVPVYHVIRNLGLLLDNQVRNQAKLSAIGTYGSGPWCGHPDSPVDTIYGQNGLRSGPRLTPHVSNIEALPSTSR